MIDRPCPLCQSSDAVPMAVGCKDYEYGIEARGGYVRCCKCGLARITHLPGPKDLDRFYPPDYANYAPPASALSRLLDRVYSANARRGVARLASKGDRILDVGCGGGDFLGMLAGMGLELHGTEFSGKAANAALDKGFQVHVGELEMLELPSGYFRIIRLHHVIEHVPDPVSSIRAAARLLAPGGSLVMETPNLCCPDFKLLGRYWGALHFPRHLHLFTPETLSGLAKKAGLRIVELSGTVMPTGWSLGLQNMLRDTVGLQVTRGRCSFYPFLMLAFLPLAALQSWFGRATMIRVRCMHKGDS